MRLNLEQLADKYTDISFGKPEKYWKESELEARTKLVDQLVELLKDVDEAAYQDGYEARQDDVETGCIPIEATRSKYLEEHPNECQCPKCGRMHDVLSRKAVPDTPTDAKIATLRAALS